MINIKKGYKDWKELAKIIKDYKDIEDIYNNCKEVSPTNYNKESNYLDVNYKTICATIHNDVNNKVCLDGTGVEVWDDTGLLDFITTDF